MLDKCRQCRAVGGEMLESAKSCQLCAFAAHNLEHRAETGDIQKVILATKKESSFTILVSEGENKSKERWGGLRRGGEPKTRRFTCASDGDLADGAPEST